MPNPAAIEDVEARWRVLSSQERAVAATLLDDAWLMLSARRPSLDADMLAGTVLPANVVRVIASMVLRVLKNPEGYIQESIDDWSGRRSDVGSDGILRVTAEELADITPGRRVSRSRRLVIYGDS